MKCIAENQVSVMVEGIDIFKAPTIKRIHQQEKSIQDKDSIQY